MNDVESPTSLKRRLRRMVGRVLRATPYIQRYFLSSADYRILTREQALAAQEASGGWLRAMTARRQQKAYEQLLGQMHAGQPRIDLAVAAEAVRATGLVHPSLLEVGCGGGYYSDVLATLVEGGVDYVGVDYSGAMIDTARAAFPGTRFEHGDATALAFADGSFDIVMNGVSLMHILDFEAAIAESRRVARHFCIYSTVPVFEKRATTYLGKHAYGAPVVEAIFNRAQLFGLFDRVGLDLVRTWLSIEYDVHPATQEHSMCETYLLKVRKR
jgi:ubiquinone/menaquinone biosynthesis C-methylase UbiE